MLRSQAVEDRPTTLWIMQREDVAVECRVRLMPYGIDVEIVKGGNVTMARTFETDAEAIAWANSKRAARESEGWLLVPPGHLGPEDTIVQ
jgi:hypothetical protein